LVLAGIANTVFSIARVLQYFLKISIGIGIGNTISVRVAVDDYWLKLSTVERMPANLDTQQ